MKSTITVLCAALAFSVPAQAAYKYASPERDLTTVNNCVYASTEAFMFAYPGCARVRMKMNISAAEMQTMRTCKWMPPAAMRADAGCAVLASRYPTIFSAAKRI